MQKLPTPLLYLICGTACLGFLFNIVVAAIQARDPDPQITTVMGGIGALALGALSRSKDGEDK